MQFNLHKPALFSTLWAKGANKKQANLCAQKVLTPHECAERGVSRMNEGGFIPPKRWVMGVAHFATQQNGKFAPARLSLGFVCGRIFAWGLAFKTLGALTMTALANSAPDAAQGAPQDNPMFSSLFFMVMFLPIFYFILIRPQRKKDKELKRKIEALRNGDEIVTIGGIYGKIIALKDDSITVETAVGNEKSRIKLARWAVKDCLTIRDE